MVAIKFLPDDSPEAVRWAQREARLPTMLPLRLTSGAGEIIPAVILSLSASGLLALVDERFSLLLPPPPGTCFEGEFFFDELEICQAELEVVRIEKRDHFLFSLGCRFIHLPPEVTAALRTKVTARFTASHRESANSDSRQEQPPER